MIRRVNTGRSHHYIDSDTGRRVPGVTTLIGDGVPKPALINWAANATIEYATDHWDRLSTMAPSARAKELSSARYAAKDTAANKGTRVHTLAEQLVHGNTVAVPDDLAGHVQSYVRFLDEWDVRPVLVEATVHSGVHDYCGTLDLVADLLDPDDPEPDPERRNRIRWLLDVKTNRSGIFGETALQLAAYRYADVWIDETAGVEYDMPQVDAVGAVHVREDGYDLIPVVAGEDQHRQFLYVAQVAAFMAAARDLVGQPLAAPTVSGYRLVREP